MDNRSQRERKRHRIALCPSPSSPVAFNKVSHIRLINAPAALSQAFLARLANKLRIQSLPFKIPQISHLISIHLFFSYLSNNPQQWRTKSLLSYASHTILSARNISHRTIGY